MTRRPRLMLGMMRLICVRLLLRLYPPSWRQRYGDELIALLDESRITLPRVLDVVRAAAHERARALGRAIFAQTGRARYVRRGFARIGVLVGATFAIVGVGFALGSYVNGTALAARVKDSPLWTFSVLLPFLALLRGMLPLVVKPTGWLGVMLSESAVTRLRRVTVVRGWEMTFWIGVALLTATTIQLQWLTWSRSVTDEIGLGGHWFGAMSQVLVIVNAVMMATPRYLHQLELGQRLRRLQLYAERRPLKYDA